MISNEIVRDMKASFYLAMSGHYRQAILIQRCAFENFLYGIYFSTEYYKFSKNEEKRKNVGAKFDQWINRDKKFQKRTEDLLEEIRDGRIISSDEKGLWKVLYNELCSFVHTIQKTPTGKSIKGKSIKGKNYEVSACYSDVQFDKDNLIEWAKYYQKVFFIILYKLLCLYPFIKREEAGKLALSQFRATFKDKRKEFDNPYLPYLHEILKMRAVNSASAKINE